jgi:hypothetical protein
MKCALTLPFPSDRPLIDLTLGCQEAGSDDLLAKERLTLTDQTREL